MTAQMATRLTLRAFKHEERKVSNAVSTTNEINRLCVCTCAWTDYVLAASVKTYYQALNDFFFLHLILGLLE